MVTSPNHPGYYPNSLEVTETIQVEQGLIISLQFTAFDIEPCGSNCVCDHLTITDGDGTILMEKSCGSSSNGSNILTKGQKSHVGGIVIGGESIGSSLPPAIRSRSNLVNLVFRTDGSVTRSGWSVSWSAVTPGECQQYI